jgi:hypothetical protein
MSIVRRVTTAYSGRVETWECLVASSTRREYVFVMYAALSTQRKHVGTTWGISGDVCHICILCSSAGTLATIT